MAKYIQKDSLPCFKYLKEIPDELMEEIQGWLDYFADLNGIKVLQMTKEEEGSFLFLANFFATDFAKLLFPDPAGMNAVPKRLKNAMSNYKILRAEMIRRYGREYRIDPNPLQKRTQHIVREAADLIITECRRLLQIGLLGGSMQGTYSPSDNIGEGEARSYLPKLLLIEDELFQKMSTNISYDFHDLFRLFPVGISFNTFVQSDKRVGKYGFCIRKFSDNIIYVSLWDRLCAGYTFVVEKAGDHSYAIYPKFTCTLRNGKLCDKSKKRPCAIDEKDCPTKKLGVVRSVLLCLQEYLVKKETMKPQTKKKNNHKDSEGLTDKFRMEGQISVFDYYQEDKESVFRERTGTGHSGYRMRPHIRSSHMRRLKTGEVVPVSASIVHKEEYNGYESAERIRR